MCSRDANEVGNCDRFNVSTKTCQPLLHQKLSNLIGKRKRNGKTFIEMDFQHDEKFKYSSFGKLTSKLAVSNNGQFGNIGTTASRKRT